MPDMLSIIKRAALDAVEAQKPTAILYGTVTSAEPLEIAAEQKLTLTHSQLVLCRSVCNFDTAAQFDAQTGAAGEPEHVHGLPEETPVKLLCALQAGDNVLLLRAAGGQKYIVIDRVVNA